MNDHPMIKEQIADPLRLAPRSRETADHSIQFMVAVALLDGEMTPRQFTDGRLFDPEVCDLMNRMVITIDSTWTKRAPGGFPCTVKLTMMDGTEATVEVPYATGHARNKMSRSQIVQKFRYCAERRLSPARAEEIIAAVDELERLSSGSSCGCLCSTSDAGRYYHEALHRSLASLARMVRGPLLAVVRGSVSLHPEADVRG